ncbi:hypothetical protein EAY19_21805, partial [Vibrio anguillarum]|nr:hypothetical protein [Vibrio anguillarum]
MAINHEYRHQKSTKDINPLSHHRLLLLMVSREQVINLLEQGVVQRTQVQHLRALNKHITR